MCYYLSKNHSENTNTIVLNGVSNKRFSIRLSVIKLLRFSRDIDSEFRIKHFFDGNN